MSVATISSQFDLVVYNAGTAPLIVENPGRSFIVVGVDLYNDDAPAVNGIEIKRNTSGGNSIVGGGAVNSPGQGWVLGCPLLLDEISFTASDNIYLDPKSTKLNVFRFRCMSGVPDYLVVT